MKSDNSFLYVETVSDLKKATADICKADMLALDTEFRREDTYFPELSLIQIATPTRVFIVDAIVLKSEMHEFLKTFMYSNVLKLVHAGQQDLEIFYRILDSKQPIPNVFDTQVAALFCGLGEFIGLESLIHKLLEISIDKSQQKTNWLQRPLSEAQKEYAGADVQHLLSLYPLLIEKLEKLKRRSWVEEEMTTLESYRDNESWTKVSGLNTGGVNHQKVQLLWNWREKTARELNLPRAWIFSDGVLKILAKKPPKELPLLQKAAPAFKKYSISAEDLFELLHKESSNDVTPLIHLSVNDHLLLESITLFLHVISRNLGLASKVIAKKEELIHFIKTNEAPKKIWKKDVFWNLAEDFLAGKTHLHIQNNTLQIS